MLNEFFVEGLVHVTNLKSDYYHYDEQSHCLFGERSKIRYSLGDDVKIVVARVSLDERKMDFSLVQSDVQTNHKDKSPYGKKPRSKSSSNKKNAGGNKKRKRKNKNKSNAQSNSRSKNKKRR